MSIEGAMKMIRLLILGALGLAAMTVSAQQLTEPGWFRAKREASIRTGITAVANTESSEEETGGFSLLSLVSPPEVAEAITPEIQALARGLENDPKRIFDYVHDHIRYVHYFGSKKGAQLTLLERCGNDFDQAALLVALLRAAGHTAGYQFGITYMPYESDDHRDLRHWIGLTKTNTNWTETRLLVFSLFEQQGFPYTDYFVNSTNDFLFHRVWVSLTTGGTNYLLDPAFKITERVSGIDVATAMGLNTSQLMSAAAGTSTTDYVQSLNESAVRNELLNYTTTLLAYFQNNTPNASVAEILGGQQVVSSATNSLAAGLPFEIYNNGGEWPVQNWDYIPTNMMTTLNVVVDGTNRFLLVPQLQGQKLALTFSAGGLAELRLEEELLLQKQTSGGSTVNVTLQVDHPHGVWNFTNQSLLNQTWNDHSATTAYQRASASYVFAYAFEVSKEWLRQRQERLAAYRSQGFSDSSREVITETLNVMGLDWLLQTERIPHLLATQQDMLLQHHHRLGRMAQESGKGYYIDVYEQLSGIHPASGVSSNDFFRSDRVFDLENYFGSAAEHGLIEQMQKTNLTAASSIKMLQLANASSQKIFLATPANWTSGSNIRSQLSNYVLTELDGYINAGYVLLLPQNGLNSVAGAGSWAGYGIVARGETDNYYTMSMLISGGYYGGYVSAPNAVVQPPVVAEINYVQPDFFVPISPYLFNPFNADPVNMANGAFETSKTDFQQGVGDAPRSVEFTRYYSSSRRHHDPVFLGKGWTHNYDIRATSVSAPLAALAESTPAQMAAMIVATKAASELYSVSENAKNWAVTALIAKWGVDQLIGNGVSVTLGKDTIQFVKQPNGVFTPPAGSTMALRQTNSVYWLQERNNKTFKFNEYGLATNIVDQYGQSTKLTYVNHESNQVLFIVSSGTNFGFRLEYYTPSLLPWHVGRLLISSPVGYGYVSNSLGHFNLVSVTDQEQKTSSFIYDTNSQIVSVKDELNQVVVSNIYDGFGRVVTQFVQGDTNKTWQLYWSDWETVAQDPAGGKHRYFYDDKSRRTAEQDALGNVHRTYYDGQDHVVKTVTPLNETNRFEFDGRHNLVRSIDPLNFTNRMIYDALDRLSAQVDARGNTNRFGYNNQHSLTGQTNAVGDWVSFNYNSDGTLESRTDAGGTTSYGYDSRGLLNRITYPGGLGSEGFLNNLDGDVLSRTNARGFVTSFQYNLRRELTNTIAPTNLTARILYDAVGNVQSTIDARNFSSSNIWSVTRKLLATISPGTPQGVPVTTNGYDNRDWLIRTVNPLQQAVTFTNDAAQRLVAATDPLQRTTRFSYDAIGRKLGATNAANEVTRSVFNARGEMLQFVDGANHVVGRGFDAVGNQTTLTNRNGKQWQFQFDAANRLTNTITPLGRETHIAYDARGLVKAVREPSTQTTTNLYDAKGRLTNSLDAVASRAIRYDANNNVTNIVENGKTNTWTFDAYDRVSSYRDADGNLIQYRFDANGNLTNLIYPGNRIVSYAYDSLNRVTNVTDWANRQTTFEYDLANRVRTVTRPNNTVRTIDYDAAGQTTNIWEQTAGGTPIARFKFNWNNAARIGWEFTAPLPHAYTPPARTMTFDDDNRLATFNGLNVTNDLDGNLTYGPLTNSSFFTCTYDARNRLLDVDGLTYGYDPAGNRVAITNGANVTRLVVNPNAALSQVLMRVRGGVTNYYIYGLGLQYEITETATSTNTLTYHYDFRGSTVALTDQNGNVTDRIEYSPYGTTTYRSGTNDTPFLYNGRYGVQTDANGLLYMRARYYNPHLCRFINADPSGFGGGLNHYAYADGNPVSLLDPFGLCAAGISEPNSWFGIGGKVDRALDALDGPVDTALDYAGAGLGALGKFILDTGDAALRSPEVNLLLLATLRTPVGTIARAETIVAAESAGSAGSVFWSGRQGANRTAAEAFAQSTGRTTLEMTPAGQALEAAGGNISQWRGLSADFARGASGEVNAFVGGSRVNSVWNTVEKPILMQNPNVQKIIIQDATQPWRTTIIYK